MTKAELIAVLAPYRDEVEIVGVIEGSPGPVWTGVVTIDHLEGKTHAAYTRRGAASFEETVQWHRDSRKGPPPAEVFDDEQALRFLRERTKPVVRYEEEYMLPPASEVSAVDEEEGT